MYQLLDHQETTGVELVQRGREPAQGVNFTNVYFGAKNYKAETFGFETLWQKDIGKKIVRKMLMKLKEVVNFTNMLLDSFFE